MPKSSLDQRVEIIEEKVGELQQLPARIDTLTSRVESLTLRVDALTSEFLQFRGEVRVEFSATRSLIEAGDEESRGYMRVLFEDAIARIALIQEARHARRKKS